MVNEDEYNIYISYMIVTISCYANVSFGLD